METPKIILPSHINTRRIQYLIPNQHTSGPVVYWMSRDQRVNDNWALLYAQHEAQKRQSGVIVLFCKTPAFLAASKDHYHWMDNGLCEVANNLANYNIPFIELLGNPSNSILSFIKHHHIGFLVADFSPLKISRQWKNNVSKNITIPIAVVDTHNIVPVWITSTKQEYAARTIRPKIQKNLSEFLTEYPAPTKQSPEYMKRFQTAMHKFSKYASVYQIQSGENAAHQQLSNFLQHTLPAYEEKRNDPLSDSQSQLSPYLHFGQIASQRIALEVLKRSESVNTRAFLEELIIRKELADNYCYYNQHYDSINGFPSWAQKTLAAHQKDVRPYRYTLKTFASAQTHDVLWNACQIQMMRTGKMHGYLRMYWAKKILEWTSSPKEAFEIALFLNDTYELDGRDPNGYTGIAWSIGGVHDRPWFERPIYGTIRYMNANGCKNKFDTNTFIKKYNNTYDH